MSTRRERAEQFWEACHESGPLKAIDVADFAAAEAARDRAALAEQVKNFAQRYGGGDPEDVRSIFDEGALQPSA